MAVRIVHHIAYDMPYDSACAYARVESLSAQRYELGRRFFAQLRILIAVYMTFFPNDETQILFLGFNDTPPILYHRQELTNIDLLSSLPSLNINNLKMQIHIKLFTLIDAIFELCVDVNQTEALYVDTKDCIVLFFFVFCIYAF